MKLVRAWWAGAAAVALAHAAIAEDQPALVSVTIKDVADEVARSIDVDASRVPLNVTVPVDVAAAACGIPAETLARKSTSGVAQCDARSAPPGLEAAVRRQVRGNAQQ